MGDVSGCRAGTGRCFRRLTDISELRIDNEAQIQNLHHPLAHARSRLLFCRDVVGRHLREGACSSEDRFGQNRTLCYVDRSPMIAKGFE